MPAISAVPCLTDLLIDLSEHLKPGAYPLYSLFQEALDHRKCLRRAHLTGFSCCHNGGESFLRYIELLFPIDQTYKRRLLQYWRLLDTTIRLCSFEDRWVSGDLG